MSAPIIAAMIASIGLFGFGLWLIVYSIPKQNTKISTVEQGKKGHPVLLKIGNLLLTIGIAVFVICVLLVKN